MSDNLQLRNLPSVDEVLRRPALAELAARHSRQRVTTWIRAAVDACRKRVLDGEQFASKQAADWIEDHVRRQALADDGLRLQQVINATGVLLHTNLGRAPLAPAAVDRTVQAAGFSNVELNLAAGKRSKRGERVSRLIAEMTRAEDALVVNNCAAATMLVLQAVAGGREVIVSRGQLVEIGGGFRLPEVFAAAGVVLREVGTTNRTYVRDYEAAIGEQTGAIIRVHRSNFRQTGFVTEPTIQELLDCRRPPDLPVIDDVGSGCLYDLSLVGLQEPNVMESVAAGADATLFSGDKLFGGPQCGIVVGKQRWIERLRVSPIMRAVRVDKLTLAALEATVEIHLSGQAFQQLPLLKMLTNNTVAIRQNCEAALQQLGPVAGAEVEIAACESQIGGGSMPGATLESFGLRITAPHLDQLAMQLRTGEPAVQPRVTADSLLLDFRTVADEQIEPLVARLKSVLS